MEDFRTAIERYFDVDNLVGNQPEPDKWSGGNELLDTGTCYLLLKLFGELKGEDKERFREAVKNCEAGVPGIYNKNPGRPDEITFDCLVGVCAGAVATNSRFALDIVKYGDTHEWVLSNTGKIYFTAIQRPWMIAFYHLAARQPISWVLDCLLSLVILGDAFFYTDDASGKKLIWTMIQTIDLAEPKRCVVARKVFQLARSIWFYRVRKTWRTVHRIFVAYYGEKHPFSVYSKSASAEACLS